MSLSSLTSTGIISDVDDGQCSSYVAMMVAFRASHGFSLMCFPSAGKMLFLENNTIDTGEVDVGRRAIQDIPAGELCTQMHLCRDLL